MDTTHKFEGTAGARRVVPPSWRLETGRVWLEALPGNWKVEKFSRAVLVAEGQVDPTEEPYVNMVLIAPNHIESRTGRLIQEETAAEQAAISGKYLCDRDDVIYSKIRPELAKVVIAPRSCLCSADMYPIKAVAPLTGRYLLYFLLSQPFTDWVSLESSRVAMPKVNRETLSEIRIPVPEPETQRAIADFLDAETARIDALITAKENLLAILAEKRRALITQTVTRGLDPHVPLRDSGIPWLGEIPAHWEDVRLRFLVDRIEQGWSPQADASEPTADEWGVLKLSAVSRGKFDPGAAKAMPSELEPRIEYEVREGDFLLTRANTPSRVGDACFVETTRPMLMLCDLIYRLRLRGDRIRGKYLCHFLVLPIGRTQIEADARGTSNSMVKISQEHIKGWRVPVPPVEEQVAIVEFLDRETGALDEMERATLLTVRLLRERREAVIAAAVTGQFPLESLSSQETAP